MNIKMLGVLTCTFIALTWNLQAADSKLVQRGRTYVRSLYSQGPHVIPVDDNDVYLNSIVAIMHYLCSKIPDKNNGQLFRSGALILEDTNWKMHTFLLDYVKRVYRGDTCKEITTTKYTAYPRKSTHLTAFYEYTGKITKKLLSTKKNCDYVHYGIDLNKDQDLPIANKHHVLFGRVGLIDGTPLLFIKFEEAGLRSGEAVTHLINLIKTRINAYSQKAKTKKQQVAMPKEKKIEKTLNEMSSEISTDDSLTKYRKERVPVEFMLEYIALILSKDGGIDKKMQKELKTRVKALGIRDIVKTSDLLSKSRNGTPAWRDSMAELAQRIKQRYPDWPLRIGNEILLKQKDLL